MEPTRMLRCSTHRGSTPMAMGLAVLALAGAHTAAAAAAGSGHTAAFPGPWHSTTTAGSVLRVPHPGAATTWRLRSGPAPARAQLTATVPAGRAVVVHHPRPRGQRPPRAAAAARSSASAPPGGRASRSAWSGRRAAAPTGPAGARASPARSRVAVSGVPVRRGRMQHLTISASATSVVVRVDGRIVFTRRAGADALRLAPPHHAGARPRPGSRQHPRVPSVGPRRRAGRGAHPQDPGHDPRAPPGPGGPPRCPSRRPALALSASDRPYDASFAFNQAIPAGAATDAPQRRDRRQLDANTAALEGGHDVASGDVPPVYIAKPTDPFYSVNVGGQSTRFRVPAGAVAGGGSDTPMVILDPSHPDFGADTELRLLAGLDLGLDPVGLGGGLFHYNSDGAILNPTGTRSIGTPFRGQGTGSGLSIMAGLIRPEEVRRGQIDHALRFAYSASDFTNRFRAPATKTDQPNGTSTRNAATAMDMGMRLQLDPAVNCAARTVPGKADSSPETRYLRMLCTTLQRYGMIAVDGTGDRGLMLMMEHDQDRPLDLGGRRPPLRLLRLPDPRQGQPRRRPVAQRHLGHPLGSLRVLDRSTF